MSHITREREAREINIYSSDTTRNFSSDDYEGFYTENMPILSTNVFFNNELKNRYKITPEQLREMMKIHYPEHLI